MKPICPLMLLFIGFEVIKICLARSCYQDVTFACDNPKKKVKCKLLPEDHPHFQGGRRKRSIVEEGNDNLTSPTNENVIRNTDKQSGRVHEFHDMPNPIDAFDGTDKKEQDPFGCLKVDWDDGFIFRSCIYLDDSKITVYEEHCVYNKSNNYIIPGALVKTSHIVTTCVCYNDNCNAGYTSKSLRFCILLCLCILGLAHNMEIFGTLSYYFFEIVSFLLL